MNAIIGVALGVAAAIIVWAVIGAAGGVTP